MSQQKPVDRLDTKDRWDKETGCCSTETRRMAGRRLVTKDSTAPYGGSADVTTLWKRFPHMRNRCNR